MAEESLFGGLSPEQAQLLVSQQQGQQGMQWGATMGPQGNPFYIPGAAAGMYTGGARLGNAVGGVFGAVPPQVAEAYKIQNVMQETEKAGIDFDTDPVGYMKVASSNFLKAGMHDKALQVMNQALAWNKTNAESDNLRAPAAGGKPSDWSEASRRVVEWVRAKETGTPTSPEQDAMVMADLKLVDPVEKTDSGDLVYAPNSLRGRVERLLGGNPTSDKFKPPVANPSASGDPSMPAGAFPTTEYTSPSGTKYIPNPATANRKLDEETRRVRNELSQVKILPVVQALMNVEEKMKPYLDTGRPIPGFGSYESFATQGSDESMIKSLGRMGYKAGEAMGSKTATEANRVLTAVDALIALDITKQAGASQTLMEAYRQFKSKALERGNSEAAVVAALTDYKEVLAAELGSVLSGVDPAVKAKLLEDKAFRNVFTNALSPTPFGQGQKPAVKPGTVRVGKDNKPYVFDGKGWKAQ